MGVDFNFPGLLDRVWHHIVFHRLVTDLLGALAVAGNEVESTSFTVAIVLNSAQPKVIGCLFHELISHSLVWVLNFFVLVERRERNSCKSDVFQVDFCDWLLAVT